MSEETRVETGKTGVTTGVYVGRFQPFHGGHKRCVEHILGEKDRCIVVVRNGQVDEANPLTFVQRAMMIREVFPDPEKVGIIAVRDTDHDLTVYIGREVGYSLIQLDADTEAISGTDLRKKMYAAKEAADEVAEEVTEGAPV